MYKSAMTTRYHLLLNLSSSSSSSVLSSWWWMNSQAGWTPSRHTGWWPHLSIIRSLVIRMSLFQFHVYINFNSLENVESKNKMFESNSIYCGVMKWKWFSEEARKHQINHQLSIWSPRYSERQEILLLHDQQRQSFAIVITMFDSIIWMRENYANRQIGPWKLLYGSMFVCLVEQ